MKLAALVLVLAALDVTAIASGPSRFEQVMGSVTVLTALVDVFLTVLYARMGYGVVSRAIARSSWRIFGFVTKPLGTKRGAALSFCGPIVLLLILAAWLCLITCGVAMIIQPVIGETIVAQTGPSSADFPSALYAAATNVSLIGSGAFQPRTPGYRLFFTATALVGVSVVTLTLTYIMQVYSAVQHRNALGAELHLLSGESGDAGEILAAIGADDTFEIEHNKIFEIGAQLTAMKEAHHHYPIIFYFRFPDPYYAASRISLLALDLGTLMKTALDVDKYKWLLECAATDLLTRSAFTMVSALENNFLSGCHHEQEPTDEDRAQWRLRYHAAVRRLRSAGIPTRADVREGADLYVQMRERWHTHVMALAPTTAHELYEIDPAGCRPEEIDARPPFRRRIDTIAL